MHAEAPLPIVSVIVPSYNHARYLRQRLDSILAQTYSDFEVIILDDASTDGSADIVNNYTDPRITAYLNNKNSGSPFKQWNAGVRKARGEYLWIAESDDYADSRFLARTIPVLEKNSHVDLIHCRSQIVDENGVTLRLTSDHASARGRERLEAHYVDSGGNAIKSFLSSHNGINNVSGVLFRKDAYIRAGYANESMKYCGDWFLYIKILQDAQVAFIAEPLNFLRFHSASSSHRYFEDGAYVDELLTIHEYVRDHVALTAAAKRRITVRLMKLFLRKLQNRHPPSLRSVGRTSKLLLGFAVRWPLHTHCGTTR